MTEQEKLIAGLERLKKMASEYENVLAKEDIREELADMNLSEEKMNFVYQYLTENKITVVNYEKIKENTEDTSEEDGRFLSMYLEELEEQTCTQDMLDDFLKRFLEGDATLVDSIVKAMLPDVVDFAKTYQNQGLLLSDLIQEGNIGLLMGVNELKPELTLEQAKEFLVKSICNAIEGALYEQDEATKTEEQMLRDAEEVNRASRELEEEYGRKPLVEDIAERLKRDVSDIEDVIKWMS